MKSSLLIACAAFSLFWLAVPSVLAKETEPKADKEAKPVAPVAPAEAVVLPSRFPRANDTIKGQYIDLDDGGRIYLRYDRISDSGVEIERMGADGKLLWRVMVEPLGVDHSKYRQDVDAWIPDFEEKAKNTLCITVEGAQRIIEARNVKNGSLISRKVEEIKR